MNTREPARVKAVSANSDYDRCFRTSWVTLALHSGGEQSFGGIHLGKVEDPDTTVEDAWKQGLLDLFQVSELSDIVGRECAALYPFPGCGERIEGLEVEERRFTITAFGRRFWPQVVVNPLEQARKKALSSIAYHTRHILEEAETLARLDATFRDWEKP